MEELGGYPQMQSMQYTTNKSSTHEDFSDSSWFGLALSGIKFLLNNQENPSSSIANTKIQSTASPSQSHNKLHILGPGVFKKQLSDIPEYPDKVRKKRKKKKTKKYQCQEDIGENALTKQALQRFNRNFTHYWHQRSSLRSHNSDDQSIAGSTQNATKSDDKTDGEGSVNTIHNEYDPSMTSSQILHPSQVRTENSPGLVHSKSFPLLHSAEHLQYFENELNKDNALSAHVHAHAFSEHNSNGEGIINAADTLYPSPPPMPSTPKLEISPVQEAYKLSDLQSCRAVKSWETVQSIPSSVRSIHSISDDDDEDDEDMVRVDDISRCMMQGPSSSTRTLSSLLNDNHFTSAIPHPQQQMRYFEKEKKLWQLQKKKLKKRKRYETQKRIHDKNCNTNSYDIVSIEKDWTDSDHDKYKSETIAIVSRPLPISTKNKKKKHREYSDEEYVFSDWSNISSNIGAN